LHCKGGFLISHEERAFEARLADLGPAIEFVESACASHGVARPDALRLAFIVEELFTNTVMHGHGGDSEAPVALALRFEPAAVSLDYADSAPAYNPMDHFHGEPSGMATTLTMRPVGGLGAYLVGQLIETSHYRREGERNLLHLRLPLGG
jgi:anti-sigma regulatory factor (Ser/Thr protein kinase)